MIDKMTAGEDMELFTMGFSKKTAREFFERIRENKIDVLIDVRLNNRSQLAGFSKAPDLEFFLDKISGTEYAQDRLFAPTKELLSDWRSGSISWEEYESIFSGIMEARKVEAHFANEYSHYKRPLLLCSEPTAKHCHRRLLAERFYEQLPKMIIGITHL